MTEKQELEFEWLFIKDYYLSRAIKETFNNLEYSKRWATTPQFGLNYRTPLEAVKTKEGKKEVLNLLGRIEQGVY